jgi:hypothetical protein
MNRFERYGLNLLIWLDEGVSTLTGGDPHDTVSARLGKAHRGDSGRFWRIATAPLFYTVEFIFGKGHCERSILKGIGNEDVAINGSDT